MNRPKPENQVIDPTKRHDHVGDDEKMAATVEALQLQTHRLRTLNRIARTIASDLDLESIVQTVTDAATDLSGAKFGAFFYNTTDASGESYVLYALSGVPRAAFDRFGLPRNTAIFAPTFNGTAIVRSDDIRQDPRYGQNAPHFGMPKGHLPVVSYLAVPVISRSGEVLGGLFFGHDIPGVFTEESEELVVAIAAHAAVAIDNARLIHSYKTELTSHHGMQESSARLAAIVESSDDAILSKNLNGIILSWNKAAERLFGYTEAEIIGQSVMTLIPAGRLNEEPEILERVRRGDRVEHYETVRRRKDGSLVDISLSVSPIRNAEGVVVGASKIARDITERRLVQEQQALMMREMSHRIKNLLTLATSVAALSARSAETPAALVVAISERLSALSRAHELILPQWDTDGAVAPANTNLTTLIKAILAPYSDAAGERVALTGTDAEIGGRSLTNMALLLHEFATNAAKYGALSTPEGRVSIDIASASDKLTLVWTERHGPTVTEAPTTQGFGSRLERGVQTQLQCQITRDWDRDGLVIRMVLPLEKLTS